MTKTRALAIIEFECPVKVKCLGHGKLDQTQASKSIENQARVQCFIDNCDCLAKEILDIIELLPES